MKLVLAIVLLLLATAFFCLAAVRDANQTVDWLPLGLAATAAAGVALLDFRRRPQ